MKQWQAIIPTGALVDKLKFILDESLVIRHWSLGEKGPANNK
jgi:hypothetical protein